MNATTKFGASFAAVVAAVIFAASVLALLTDPETMMPYLDQFELVVSNTLLPLLEATLAALVAFTVGREIASSLGRRGQDEVSRPTNTP